MTNVTILSIFRTHAQKEYRKVLEMKGTYILNILALLLFENLQRIYLKYRINSTNSKDVKWGVGVEGASFHGFVNDGSLWNIFWCFLCIFYYRNSSILKILRQFENLGFVIMSTRENIRLIARTPLCPEKRRRLRNEELNWPRNKFPPIHLIIKPRVVQNLKQII